MKNTLTAEENSQMVVLFTINNFCNHDPLNHTAVTIKKAFGNHDIVCYFEHPSGRCEEYDQPYCECPSEISRLYRLVIPVDRSDAGVWKWSATNSDKIKDAVVTLVVTYPAEIEEMTFWSKGNPVTSPVVQNSSVTILCSWDKGVPAVTSYLRLLDRRGNELQRTDSSNQKEQINYTVNSVQCDHAGLILCETDGGSLQKNRTLLVECAPKVYSPSKDIIISSPTKDLRVEFSVRSHSVHIMKCCLKKIKESPGVTSKHNTKQLSYSCKRNLTLNGSPPHMTFYLNLTNLTSEMAGSWKLDLFNNIGVGSFVYNISLPQGATTGVPTWISTSEPGGFEFAKTPFGITVISVNVCIILAIIGIAFHLRSRGRRSNAIITNSQRIIPTQANQLAERPLPHEPMVRLADLEAIMRTQQLPLAQSDEPFISHDYEEVKNNIPGAEGGTPLAAAKHPPHTSPIEEDDTYLHPVSSALDVTQNQDEPDLEEHYSLPSNTPAYRSDNLPPMNNAPSSATGLKSVVKARVVRT
ncbi:uncharacterized protein [Littorina saxatilis]